MTRESICETMENVADHGAGRRGDHADYARQIRQRFFVFVVEQSLGGQFLPALFQERHQRADARGLDRVDHDLIGRFSGIGRDLAGRDYFHALFGLEAHPSERALPDDGVDPRTLVLQAEIDVTRGMRAPVVEDLAAQPDIGERLLHRPLQGTGELGDADFR